MSSARSLTQVDDDDDGPKQLMSFERREREERDDR